MIIASTYAINACTVALRAHSGVTQVCITGAHSPSVESLVLLVSSWTLVRVDWLSTPQKDSPNFVPPWLAQLLSKLLQGGVPERCQTFYTVSKQSCVSLHVLACCAQASCGFASLLWLECCGFALLSANTASRSR